MTSVQNDNVNPAEGQPFDKTGKSIYEVLDYLLEKVEDLLGVNKKDTTVEEEPTVTDS